MLPLRAPSTTRTWQRKHRTRRHLHRVAFGQRDGAHADAVAVAKGLPLRVRARDVDQHAHALFFCRGFDFALRAQRGQPFRLDLDRCNEPLLRQLFAASNLDLRLIE